MITLYLTANRATNSLAENWISNKKLLDLIINTTNFLSIEEVLGSFKEEGQEKPNQEHSFKVVFDSNCEARKLIATVLKQFKQDAVLLVTNSKDCSLVTFDGGYLQYTSLGTWQEISKEEAQENECYTLDSSERYWLAK